MTTSRKLRKTKKHGKKFSAGYTQILCAMFAMLLLYTTVTVVALIRIFSVENDRHLLSRLRGSTRSQIENLQHHFPVHVGDDFEEIEFPAFVYLESKKDFKLKVPRFWDPKAYGPGGVREFLGNYGKRLITPEEASQIGSFNKDGLKTIYISIASYRDPECTITVEDLFLRAKYPNRIRLAVVDQLKEGDSKCSSPEKSCEDDPEQALCKYRHLMEFFEVDGDLSVGPVFARHLAHRMYRGEYFAMQVDAHMRFTKDWDDDLIGQWKSAKNEMAVATAYPSNVIGSIDPNTHERKRFTRPIMCETDFEGSGDEMHLEHGQQPEGDPLIHDEPMLEPFWAAGFSFARGHFVVQVPYDQYLPMVFQGEEINIGLRGFTYGYDYYTMERAVCFHMYAVKQNKEKRKKIKLFWENSGSYTGVGAEAMKRLNGIIGMGRPGENYYKEEEQKYGMGKVRTSEKFFKTFGIHTDTETVEQNLCRFVGRPMLAEFKPKLRSNRMGIDYDKITYVFVDPLKDKNKRR
mmetsp:Transcript_22771/g.35144  ORF Transcript_22771/g.35144 Transcript_22771/m.35144 type:complete len:518 (-) Transcript_22771:86-1639(-)